MQIVVNNKWVVLFISGVAIVLALTVWFSATAVAPELEAHFGLTTFEAAWLTNGVQIGFVVGAILSTLLSLPDVVRLTYLMACSACLAGIANAALLLEPNFAGLIAMRFVTGIALAGVYPPAMKFVATWFQKGRGLAMGAVVGALTLGSALPHLIGSLEIGLDWTLVIKISSFACLISALIFLLLLKEGPFPFAKTKVDPYQIGKILRNKRVMLANAGYFGHMWELYAMWGWFLAFVVSANEVISFTINPSFLAFLVVGIGAPSCVVAGVIADKYGRSKTTAIILSISGACAILIGFAVNGPEWLFILIACIWGATIIADSAQFSALVTEFSPPTLVGTALTFQMGIGFLITIIVIWAVPHFAEWMGSWRWSFLILAPGPILGAFAMMRLNRLQ